MFFIDLFCNIIFLFPFLLFFILINRFLVIKVLQVKSAFPSFVTIFSCVFYKNTVNWTGTKQANKPVREILRSFVCYWQFTMVQTDKKDKERASQQFITFTMK